MGSDYLRTAYKHAFWFTLIEKFSNQMASQRWGLLMLREFDTGQAVVIDGSGNVLRQLVKFERTKRGHTHFALPHVAMVYIYKKDAINACRLMHWPQDHIERGENMASSFWFIRYDFRGQYALACWDV